MKNSLIYLSTILTVILAFPLKAQSPHMAHHQLNKTNSAQTVKMESLSGGQVRAVAFNSREDEFSLNIFSGGWYFVGGSVTSGHGSHDIYVLDTVVSMNTPALFSKKINSHKDEGVFALYDQGNQLIFGRNDSHYPGNRRMRLYHSKKDLAKGKWSKPKRIVIGPEAYSYAHPVISADGNFLYFSSNMTGAVGGADIFRSQWRDGSWSAPVHLGNAVNTTGDEFPSGIDANGNLLFASNGMAGKGGFDVFRAIPSQQGFQVQTIEGPLNSPFDDFGLTMQQGRYFFASNREGGRGGYDLYELTLPMRRQTESTQKIMADKAPEVNQRFAPASPEEVPNKRVRQADRVTFTRDGFEQGWLLLEEDMVISGSKNDIEAYLKRETIEIATDYVIKPTRYELGQYLPREEEISVTISKLVTLLKEKTSINVLLTGHTDCTGASAANEVLGLKRANYLKQLLVAQGISASRVATASGSYLKDCPQSEEDPSLRRTDIDLLLNESN